VTLDHDVVVVGAGGGGLAAALTAAEAGARVALLEKAARVGGTTRLAIGSITAAGTVHQRRRGIADTWQALDEDLDAFAGPLLARDNPELRRRLARDAAATLRWLLDLGVPFVGPYLERPHRVPRTHNAVPGARAIVAVLERRARRAGVRVHLDTRATGLLREGGRIAGVETAHGRFRARAGVVLATGDYSASVELRQAFMTPEAAAIPAANPLATGDGHRMAAEVGGELLNMDLAMGPELRVAPPSRPPLLDRVPVAPSLVRALRVVAPRLPQGLIRLFVKQVLTSRLPPCPDVYRAGALLVDSRGHRLDVESHRPGVLVARQPDNRAHVVLDGRLASEFSSGDRFLSVAPGVTGAYWTDYAKARADLIRTADSPEALAREIGADPETLARSVADHNAKAATPLRPPLHSLGPLHALMITTEGGLRIDEACRVLGRDGAWIDGLYAVGSVGQGGMLLAGHGFHILWAIMSGRRAGAAAAAPAAPGALASPGERRRP
jgi:succinate dehydrogenase/fumarate reductase flavoprotein subunit